MKGNFLKKNIASDICEKFSMKNNKFWRSRSEILRNNFHNLPTQCFFGDPKICHNLHQKKLRLSENRSKESIVIFFDGILVTKSVTKNCDKFSQCPSQSILTNVSTVKLSVIKNFDGLSSLSRTVAGRSQMKFRPIKFWQSFFRHNFHGKVDFPSKFLQIFR